MVAESAEKAKIEILISSGIIAFVTIQGYNHRREQANLRELTIIVAVVQYAFAIGFSCFGHTSVVYRGGIPVTQLCEMPVCHPGFLR